MDSIKNWLKNAARTVGKAIVVGAQYFAKFLGFAAAVTVDACIVVCTAFVLGTVVTALTNSAMPLIVAVCLCMLFVALIQTSPKKQFWGNRPTYATVDGEYEKAA